MPRLHIDGREVDAAPGETLLSAARRVGIDIPTLCYLERCGPMTSCLVCVVKVTRNGRAQVVPSCAARAEEGLVVESETDEVRELRRTALELLLSDHVGDCLSPCHRICPLDLNIPRMIRQIEAGQLGDAIATIRRALALPAVLGRLCHAPCQNGCRRGGCGGPASIRDLERFVADADLGSAARYLPPRKPGSGKRVAIVGAGPTGLAAAYQLLLDGHQCVVFDRQNEPGGTLRRHVHPETLPRDLLDAEIRFLEMLGAEFRRGMTVGTEFSVERLRADHDAVLIAAGELTREETAALGLEPGVSGVRADPATGETGRAGVFAAGSAVRPVRQIVRAMSEGQAVAGCLHQFLAGLPVRPPARTFSSVMGRLEDGELGLFLRSASPDPRTAPAGGAAAGFDPAEAHREAARCLHCDCRAAGSCSLQHYAEVYGANPSRFARQRRPFRQELHPADVLFEPGKCILCGLCIEIARQAAEPLGLTFVGRGFDVRVDAPLGHPFGEGLRKVAADCVEHCPTGAIVFREDG